MTTMNGQASRRALVSAHRGGCGRRRSLENTIEGIRAAVSGGADFVEFDVQRSRDGVYLLHHDRHVIAGGRLLPVAELTVAELDTAVGPRARYTEVLDVIAGSRCNAHIDLKLTSLPEAYEPGGRAWEVDAAALALAVMPATRFIVTSTEDQTVRAVREWAVRAAPGLLVGLAIGKRDLTGLGLVERLRWRAEEIFPERRIRVSRTNLLVPQRHLARLRLIGLAGRRGLPVLVWTVDSRRELERLCADPRVWMVTTNYPERAPIATPSSVPPAPDAHPAHIPVAACVVEP
jgi:glycerophosphoryl diester phosphodiesterase